MMAKNKQKPRTKRPRIDASDKRRKSRSDIGAAADVRFDRLQWLYLLALVVVGALIYANTLQSPFIFDDGSIIVDNPAIRMEKLGWTEIYEAISGTGSNRPLSNLTFALNYYFGRYNPLGYHIVNMAVHIVSGLLLYFFLKTTLNICRRQSLWRPRLDRLAISTISGMTALLWLANPVQTQSVTYIVQRSNSLAAMFFVLALLLYAKGRVAHRKVHPTTAIQSAEKGKGRSWRAYHICYPACAVAGILALGSKENAAVLPFFIWLYEWYFFQNLSKKWLKKQSAVIAAILLLFGIVAFAHLGLDPWEKFKGLRDFSAGQFTVGQRLLTQTRVVVYYLSLIFFPHPSRLNLDYDFSVSQSLVNPYTTLISLVLIIALIIAGVWLARKKRLISFCIWWFLGNLFIESSVIPLAIIFEHRLYLPSMLMFLVPLILMQRYFRSEWLMVGLSCAVLVLFSYWTHERNKVWRSEVTLWADCVKKSPNKARPYNNLGAAQKSQSMDEAARQNILTALTLNPNYADAHYNLGRIFEDEKEMKKAIGHYRKAIELMPEFMEAHNNLGMALLKQNKLGEAKKHLNLALRMNPAHAEVHHNLGLAHFKEDKIDRAINHYRKALELNPDLVETQFNLGVVLIGQGQKEQGAYHLQRAVQLNPDHDLANTNMAGYLLSQGKLDEAAEHLERAIKVNPDLAEAHNNLGIILIRQGNPLAAISHFQKAVEINPKFKLAQKNLSQAMAIRNNSGQGSAASKKDLKDHQDDSVRHYERGNKYLGERKLHKAIIEFEKALALKPDYLEAQNNLAMAYAADLQYDRALAAFKKLIELDPANAGSYYNIAVLYALQNNVPQSIAWLKKAIARGYHNWELVKTDPDLASIRNSAEYQQLIKGR